MSVKISELPVLDSLADNDVLAGVDTSANTTSKVTLGSLKQYIDTNTQYTAGTNIDITNNVVSAPNVYNKTETDNLLNAKENISNKVTTLSSSSTNTQYPSAKIVYDELSDLETNLTNDINDLNDEINNKIQELEEELESVSTIFNAFPTESEEGESFTLDDTAEVKFKKLDLKGNTSQTSYSGKNLLGVSNGSKTSNGITLTITNNNILTYSGTATGTYARFDSENHTLPAGTYTFSIDKATTGNECVVLYCTLADNSANSFQISTNNTSITKTLSSSITQWYVGINSITSGTSYSGTFKLQLESGSTKTDYEPYVGGTASPSPSYPQPVNVVSGDNSISVRGTNYFNLTVGEQGGIDTSGNNISDSSNWRSKNFIEVEPNTSYTFSVNNINSYTLRLYEYNSSQTFISPRIEQVGASLTITTTSNTKYLKYTIYSVGVTMTQAFIDTLIPRIVKTGEEATYPINLPVENLFDTTKVIGAYISENNGVLSLTSTNGYNITNENVLLKDICPNLKVGETYILSFNNTDNTTNHYNDIFLRATNTYWTNGTSRTITQTDLDGRIAFYGINSQVSNIQISKGTKANSYTPYGTTPIELCKIGDYQDYFLHDKTLDKWYWHREVGKYTFSDLTTWNKGSSAPAGSVQFYTHKPTNFFAETGTQALDKIKSNCFINQDRVNGMRIGGLVSFFPTTDLNINDTDTWKQWTINNSLTIYYALATPTDTEVTYQPLIEQLNNIEKAMSYNGQTNISQVNNDLPFIISAEAILSLKNVLDRIELLES